MPFFFPESADESEGRKTGEVIENAIAIVSNSMNDLADQNPELQTLI
jgi:hypothetical protein